MRSFSAAVAAAWFLFQSLTFVPDGAFQNGGPFGVIEGDPAAVAVAGAARVLAFGLALVAIAMVDWEELRSLF